MTLRKVGPSSTHSVGEELMDEGWVGTATGPATKHATAQFPDGNLRPAGADESIIIVD